MAAGKKSQRKLARELKQARAEHKELLKRVEKARSKFEKRSQKLVKLEHEIAHLEQHYFTPTAERMGQADAEKDRARPARLIFNTDAGDHDSTQELDRIVRALRGHGIAAQVDVRTSAKEARALAREAVENGEELVIVAGGDNTVEDVARELVGTNTAMGIIPSGTNNNIAQALGIPLHLGPACALIGMGTTRFLDVGEVIDGQGSHEYFLESAGVGLADGVDSQSLPHVMKNFDIQPGRIEIDTDTGETVTLPTSIITVSDAPLMGSNSAIAPGAKMDDGLLDVLVFEGMTFQEVLDYIKRTSDQQPDTKGVKSYRARHVRIEATNMEGNELDGKLRRLEIKVLPQALAVVVGNGPALTLPVESAPADVAADGKNDPEENGNSKNKSSLPILGMFKKQDKQE